MNRRAAVTIAAAVGIAAIAGGGYYARHEDEIARAQFERRRGEYERAAWANLRAGLEHSNKFVRIDAAGRLALLGDGSGWPVLLQALRDPNPIARQAAAVSLPPFEEKAVPEIQYLLETGETFVRERAFSALGYMQCPEAQALLLAEYENPTHVNMRIITEAMWLSMPERTVQETLDAVVAGRDDRAGALTTSWIGFRDDCPRHHGVTECGHYETDLLRGLDALGERNDEAGRRADALAASIRHVAHPPTVTGDPLQEALAHLRDPDPDIRWEAAQVLAEKAPDEALPDIADALRDEKGDRVFNTLLEMLIRRRPDLAAPLAAYAVREGGPSKRTSTSDALREYPHPDLIEAYAAALESEHTYVRLAAVEALNEIVHPDRDRLLAKAFADSDARVLVLASAALLRR